MFDDRELSDLETNAHDAFAAYMDTYTASSVLHEIFMNIFEENAEGISAIISVQSLLSTHRAHLSDAWLTAQDAWLFAIQLAYDSDLYSGEDDDL